MRTGINDVLYKLVCTGPPAWATALKDEEGEPVYFITEHAGELSRFLMATTDSVRLAAASYASRALLAHYDLAELEDLRATVQLTELMRRIPYGRQTDHSAHTLYLYLLGVAFFLHNEKIRQAFAKWLRYPADSGELLDRFLLQWSFASILHDVGYIFQGTRADRRAVDRVYRSSSINRVLGASASNPVKQRITQIIAEKDWHPRFEDIDNPEEIFDKLRSVPWFHQPYKDIFEIFAVSRQKNGLLDALGLEDYAYAVAASGYDARSEGTLDHAVAGGLFLFNYSSYWAWLASAMRYEGPFAAFQDGYLEKEIVNACFAVAAHNVIQAHALRVGKLNLTDHPLLYLGVLCDELQKWDRFPAGQQFLADLDLFAKYCTDSENLSMLQDMPTQRFVFTYTPGTLHESVRQAIETRLDEPADLAGVSEAPSDPATPAEEEVDEDAE